MKPLRITIVLPFPVTKPVGGAKVMYEYANRLRARGHRIVIVHSLRRPFKKMKSPLWWKRFGFWLQRARRPRWFALDPSVDCRIVNEISDRYLPDADIVFSTWWQMAYAIAGLSPRKGKPVNMIQDYELWAGQEERVHASYALPVNHFAYAHYLKAIADSYNQGRTIYAPGAVDTVKFRIELPIEARPPRSIIMMYSEEPRKGTRYGLEALIALRSRFPDLSVTLFSVYHRPADLPAWIAFHRRPADLTTLYNQHAIFFSPSLGEGWALPPAEAMACGCAVVCTRIGGHADYGKDGESALLVEVKDPADMQRRLASLLEDSPGRIALARRGNQYLLANFNWDHSVDVIEESFARLAAEAPAPAG